MTDDIVFLPSFTSLTILYVKQKIWRCFSWNRFLGLFIGSLKYVGKNMITKLNSDIRVYLGGLIGIWSIIHWSGRYPSNLVYHTVYKLQHYNIHTAKYLSKEMILTETHSLAIVPYIAYIANYRRENTWYFILFLTYVLSGQYIFLWLSNRSLYF